MILNSAIKLAARAARQMRNQTAHYSFTGKVDHLATHVRSVLANNVYPERYILKVTIITDAHDIYAKLSGFLECLPLAQGQLQHQDD